MSCTDPAILEFPFFEGVLYLSMCERDTLLSPQKDTLDNLTTPEQYVTSRRRSPNLQLAQPNDSLVLSLCGSAKTSNLCSYITSCLSGQ